MLLDIVLYPDPFLKTVAQPVMVIDEELKTLVANMAETMYAAPGVGLAAVQVGVDKAVLVYDVSDPNAPDRDLHVLLNPKIISMEGQILSEEEGCLSFPDFRADVTRAQKVVVHAMDLDGNQLEIIAEDFCAIVLQHEIEHLFGHTFIEKASPLKRQMYNKKIRKQDKLNV